MMKLRKELIILGLTVIASLLAFAFDPFNLRGNHPNWSEGVYFTIYLVGSTILILGILGWLFFVIMPYETRKEGCPEDKPHGVFKKGTDQKMGCHATPEAAGAQIAAMHARENMTTEQVFISNESYVNVTPGEAVRLFPFGELKRGGVTRNITPALASRFRLPNFKPPIKLGSHADEAPAGGHIIGLEVRDDGVYALTETTPKGRLAFDEGDYRYHSPEVIWDEPMEMPDGSKVEPPIILGMALLHTPYLGDAAAIYTHKEKELEMPEETVAVPRTLWDSVVSLFSQKPPAPKSEEPSIKPEEFTALQKERDDYAAKIEAMEAERAKAELLTAIRGEFATEEYGAAFTSLVTGEDAETVIDHLAGMPEKTRAWALQQLRALSAPIDESKLPGEER